MGNVNGYDVIHQWFDILKNNGQYIKGFVPIAIGTSHVHAIVGLTETQHSIKTIVGNGKRFMAYKIIRRLQQLVKQKY